jgi:hypothetical protein
MCVFPTDAPDRHRSLVGKWRGTVTVGRAIVFIYLTIEQDRTLVAIWGDITTRGTVTISGGQASYQMAPPPQEGTLKCTRTRASGSSTWRT